MIIEKYTITITNPETGETLRMDLDDNEQFVDPNDEGRTIRQFMRAGENRRIIEGIRRFVEQNRANNTGTFVNQENRRREGRENSPDTGRRR